MLTADKNRRRAIEGGGMRAEEISSFCPHPFAFRSSPRFSEFLRRFRAGSISI
jgi:hypothetical protein